MSKSGDDSGGDTGNGTKGGSKGGFPQYCKTDAGVLGPFQNNSVKVGEPCFGTKDGQRYDGVAVMSKSGEDSGDATDGGGKGGFPQYCKTDAGVLGPYQNNSVKVGEPCFGTKDGKRYDGVAVMTKGGN
jgi:hypothetical protein